MVHYLGFFLICLFTPLKAESVSVNKFVLARKIIKLKPYDIVHKFHVSDRRGHAFASLLVSKNQVLFYKWYFEDKLYAQIPIPVKVSPRYRVCSSVHLKKGNWRVELIDKAGHIIAAQKFEVDDEAKTLIEHTEKVLKRFKKVAQDTADKALNALQGNNESVRDVLTSLEDK